MDFKFSCLSNDEWAKKFDVVVYNNCNLDMRDAGRVEKIMATHAKYKVPAVITHCPMHGYRSTTKKWYNFIGAVSYHHETDRTPYTVENMRPNHPIMVNGMWRTPKGELYMPIELKDNATPLARAYGDEGGEWFPVLWTHNYKRVRIVSNTLGHHNATMGSDVNLNVIAASVLWVTGNLKDDGTPKAGYSGKRGLGWISLWNTEDWGETLNGWRASKTTKWWRVYGGEMNWDDGEAAWPSEKNLGNESFKFKHTSVDHNTIVVDGSSRYLYYKGAVDGRDFQNFEFKAEVYTYPGANSGIFFHTRFKDDGPPHQGYEADINTVKGDGQKTGGLNPGPGVSGDLPHKLHEYFEYYIRVDGNQITTKVKGETVTIYSEPFSKDGTHTLDRGTIALESTDAEGPVYFRNMLIRLWPDKE